MRGQEGGGGAVVRTWVWGAPQEVCFTLVDGEKKDLVLCAYC